MGDVMALKAELQAQLGSNLFSDYYRLLATFLSAKLSKREFDNYIKHNLKDKVVLHNAFVLAILGQAFAATPAPDVLNARAAKSRDKRRPKKAKLSGSLPIKSHLRDTTGIRTPKKMWLGRERGAAVAVDGGSGSKERRELSQRVKAIADEEGIERVDEEAVDAIQNALHAHLLRLLKSAAPVSENNTTGGAGVFGGAGVKRERENNSNAAPLISRASLRVAVSKNGKGLLCDDLPLQREKLLLAE